MRARSPGAYRRGMTADRRRVLVGFGLTLLSAVCFSWLGVLTQLAYGAGVDVGTALVGRFLLAAGMLWILVWLGRARRPEARDVVAGLALGALYSVHALLFSESLTRLDPGLLDLLLFSYPTVVMLGAVALRRERWSAPRAVGLAAATAGTGLVLVGGVGSIDPRGAALALASSLVYSAYILSSAGQLERTNPLALAALVATAAVFVLGAGATARGDVSLHVTVIGLALIVAVGVVTVTGMTTFIGGISRLGAARASIVSAVQPALTPVIGFAVFSDRLGPTQVVGAALVIAAVVVAEAGDKDRSDLRLKRHERRRIARRAAALDVPAGSVLVQQGALPEAFFVIERGQTDVIRDGRKISALGPGDFFGEVALMSGGLRTASVVSKTAVRVRSLDKSEFTRLLVSHTRLGRMLHRAALERARNGSRIVAPAIPRAGT